MLQLQELCLNENLTSLGILKHLTRKNLLIAITHIQQ